VGTQTTRTLIFWSGRTIVTIVLLEGYMVSCGRLRAQKWHGPKPPSTTSTITCLNDNRSQHHLHASCLPMGHPPPHIIVHDQLIIGKERIRASYSRCKVFLASKSFVTNKEHGDHPNSMQPVPEHFNRLSLPQAEIFSCIQLSPVACNISQACHYSTQILSLCL
jgi:hypothetical protein